ncbi:D-2-hydroxyacid dehydrogenase family protein [Rhodoplanes sp. TEM]|uniref:D-2-hydroxyacid dehydrogenase family protein n=1 Tax=Rhodoplanes tepidamans TaxID=200616 RepID=A0ABT5JJW9_RHOTP|nr:MULTISPECIES: D-2-hydroxyacid dehydrogenase family protein [Rhodoplanes]MDC7789887.1 D-2-hydroxyacid dehydrogenase family protein [Rhodoplanes tepidamans]MDC7985592.1 D-2-hydroxyacid dehydrogenase family protein [Rhodoplanes sp. TEM]MDQ0358781.1 D-3-phosphoglycerate dehydrogenase [Rhodoplanes tepidamans]
MGVRCAVLDDYQNVALTSADWSSIAEDVDVTVFDTAFASPEAARAALQPFPIVCMMRERTPFPRAMIEALPNLKLLITTGAANRAIDLAAARDRGVVVCGTGAYGNPTIGIVFGLILELTRRIGFENARMKAGAPLQATVGDDIEGKTLGILGLGKLGTRVAGIASAFRMPVIAWSPNMTAEKAAAAGATLVSKDELFARSDILTIHVQLSDRSRGLVGAREIGLMKPDALLINTSRGPIVDEAALLAALTAGKLGGAGLDVYDIEPLPVDHPFRTLDSVVTTPHLGYVTKQNYAIYFRDMVEDIRAFLDGTPVRVIGG